MNHYEIEDAFNNKCYCVYAHFQNEECFYIGMGTAQRSISPEWRNELWNARYKEAPVTVKILHRTHDRREAFNLERHLIRVMKPSCNLTGVVQTRSGRKRKVKVYDPKPYKYNFLPIKCEQTGKYYVGSAEAGRDMGIHQARISAVVNGRCRSADGYTFKRVSWEEAGMKPRERPLIRKD